MSRLIDADALEKVITEEWFLEIIATQDSKSGVKKNIVNAIDSAPTAYDVDKVVAELDEAECSNCSMYCADTSVCGHDEMRKQSIDIVKRGGVDEKK